ncbi:uncharacterized protein BJ212DRAFT_344711 [Suillus subaureus]|uniref:F-box domain-containing protein n=1 Tax=Suillus subaureus TaxID=48587 RepID=A0A9P7E8S1_9AGAM|nr:uncharacterized protein BJ212DRAFT_344711 [Suillus subaureus]KAG1814653.1 hypothetical protein BJ212DRAFT_344711 [Suillus subaureus]
MHRTPSLDNLVDDILLQIFQILSVQEILTLRQVGPSHLFPYESGHIHLSQTSKRYYLLSKLRSVWYVAFCTEVLARHLPPPGPLRALHALPSAELEHRTLLALSLEKRWPRSTPKVIVSSRKRDTVDQILLIPGGTQVLTVHGNKVVYWLISGQPGATQGLQKVGEWSSPSDDTCTVVKDTRGPGNHCHWLQGQTKQTCLLYSLSP